MNSGGGQMYGGQGGFDNEGAGPRGQGGFTNGGAGPRGPKGPAMGNSNMQRVGGFN